MRVLVTGGVGFIGSRVVAQLTDAGCEVVVLDKAVGTGDVRDPDAWLGAARGVDAVCHQAAKVGLGIDFGDVCDYVADNDGGTAAGLWALHELGFAGRLVLASSMVVYGEGRYRCAEHGVVRPPAREVSDLEAGRFDARCPACVSPLQPEAVPEDAPADPRNVYAATKLHQEHLCSAFAREHPGVAFSALRYHNVYGPGMPRNSPYAGVAALFADALASGRAPRVFEDGGQLRDFVHVDDVARANVLALGGDGAMGAFNIASGQPRSVLDLASALADAHGDGAPRPQVVGGYRLGDVRHVFASPDKAARFLGFRAEVDFAAGIASVL